MLVDVIDPPVTSINTNAVVFNGSAMDAQDAVWYNDVTPLPTAAPLPLLQVSASACTTVADTRRRYNPSRQLMRMDSEQALNSYIQESRPDSTPNNNLS